jgi:hypothetical protein
MAMGPEEQLSAAFADLMKDSKTFCKWVLGYTKFAELADEMRLLHEEQLNLRPRMYWWRDWWCKLPAPKKGRQIDIFAVFELEGEKRLNVALLIENKRMGEWTDDGQPTDYKTVAEYKKRDPEWMNFIDYETVILAPKSILRSSEAQVFDCKIAYEDVAGHIPLFKTTL